MASIARTTTQPVAAAHTTPTPLPEPRVAFIHQKAEAAIAQALHGLAVSMQQHRNAQHGGGGGRPMAAI